LATQIYAVVSVNTRDATNKHWLILISAENVEATAAGKVILAFVWSIRLRDIALASRSICDKGSKLEPPLDRSRAIHVDVQHPIVTPPPVEPFLAVAIAEDSFY
jgi:hypothetical protein